MNQLDLDVERLELLLDELDLRALRPGQPAYQGMQELGQFVEEVHLSLGNCLGFDWNAIKIDAWHVELAKHGAACHPAAFGSLNTIFGHRNIASHPNEDKHSLTLGGVRRGLEEIKELLPRLVRLLPGHTLVDQLFVTQKNSHQHFRAEALCAAIEQLGPLEEYLPIAIEFGIPFVPLKKKGFLKAPETKQLRPLLAQLASLAGPPDGELLGDLANKLEARAKASWNLQPLRGWRGRFGTPWSPNNYVPRLPVLRVSIQPDPRDAKGFLLCDFRILWPPVANAPAIGTPLRVEQLHDLPAIVTEWLNKLKEPLIRSFGSGSYASARQWHDFVLQIETPARMSVVDFELARSPNAPRTLQGFFRCITLRPTMPYELLQPLHGLEIPVAHPKYAGNSIAAWKTSNPEALRGAAQGHDCLFTGPSAWSQDHTPPIVEAFEGFPGAVVCETDDERGALSPLFGEAKERTWPEILDRVTELRRGGARLKVLWNDPQYDIPLAESASEGVS